MRARNLFVFLGLLSAATLAWADGNDTCPGAGISALPFNDTGTTVGGNNTVASIPAGCSAYTTVAGPDKIYRLVVSTAGSLTVTVTPTGATGYDPAIYLLNDAVFACPSGTGATAPGGSCTAGRDAGSFNAAETFTVASLAAGTYNLFIDSFYSTGSAAQPNRLNGPFTLAVTGTAVLGAGTSADTSITKTDGVASVTAGGSTTYTITASNAGPGAATGATVTDTFPAALTCTWTCVGAGGGTCTASGSGNISDTVNLPSGASATYTAVCAISGAATGSLANTATVANPVGTSDPIPGNNSATDTDTIVVPVFTYTLAPTSLNFSGTVGIASAAQSAVVTAGAANTGNLNVSNCTFGGTNPGDFAFSPAPSFPASVAAAGTLNLPISFTAGAVGARSATLDCSVPNATAPSATAFQVTLSGTGIAPNISPTLTYTPAAASTINFPAGPAGTANSNIAITSSGASGGGFTSVTACGFTGANPTAFSASTTPADGIFNTATTSGSINLTCTRGPTVSTATLTCTETTGSAARGNNTPRTWNVSCPAADSANVSGTKTVAGNFQPGGAVTYTIVLNNTGAAAQGDNAGNEFTDNVPGQLTVTSVSATAGTATAAGNVVSWNGSIAAGGSVTITINATINNTLGQVSNQGNFSFDGDGNGTNEATGVTDDPAVGGAGNATVFAITGALQPIPTLSDAGRLLAVLSVMLLGFLVWRQRQS